MSTDDTRSHDGDVAAVARRRAELAAVQAAFARRVGPERLANDERRVVALAQRAGADADARAEALISRIAPKKLATYRVGLRFKRLDEVRALLPQTRRALGEEFDRAFLAFCETFEPLGFARHREDAIAFAATIRRAEARVERAYLLAARNVAGVWLALGSRGLVVLARLRAGARLRRFSLDLPFASR